MIDFARITVKAGDGGGGAGSFRHTKSKRRGKADGGDGGDGGNVFLEATNDMNTLEPYRFVKDYSAKNGERGLSNLKNGARGEDLVLKVPVGTEIRLSVAGSRLSVSGQSVGHETDKQKTDELESENRELRTDNNLIYDLVEASQRVLIARGGEHGRGNAHLRDEFGRRPLAGEKGGEGESVSITLELKLIAQVGLIGLPNAGKSTLLAALTNAKPEIADYPFTTLEPNLGVMNSSQFTLPSSGQAVHGSRKKKTDNREPITVNRPVRLVLADIPGLIEGASRGKGLGDLFLRHIERTKILVHLIDGTEGQEGWEGGEGQEGNGRLLDQYKTIRNELKAYSKELAKKKEIIVLTKADLLSKGQIESAKDQFKSMRRNIFVISAKTGEGIEGLVKEMRRRL